MLQLLEERIEYVPWGGPAVDMPVGIMVGGNWLLEVPTPSSFDDSPG